MMTVLMIQLHAIGASRRSVNWTSAATSLGENRSAQLDIMDDMSGSLRFSALSAHSMPLGARIRR